MCIYIYICVYNDYVYDNDNGNDDIQHSIML